MKAPGHAHRFEMVSPRLRGWSCTQGHMSHNIQAVVACRAAFCAAGWCVDCIPEDSQQTPATVSKRKGVRA